MLLVTTNLCMKMTKKMVVANDSLSIIIGFKVARAQKMGLKSTYLKIGVLAKKCDKYGRH